MQSELETKRPNIPTESIKSKIFIHIFLQYWKQVNTWNFTHEFICIIIISLEIITLLTCLYSIPSVIVHSHSFEVYTECSKYNPRQYRGGYVVEDFRVLEPHCNVLVIFVQFWQMEQMILWYSYFSWTPLPKIYRLRPGEVNILKPLVPRHGLCYREVWII